MPSGQLSLPGGAFLSAFSLHQFCPEPTRHRETETFAQVAQAALTQRGCRGAVQDPSSVSSWMAPERQASSLTGSERTPSEHKPRRQWTQPQNSVFHARYLDGCSDHSSGHIPPSIPAFYTRVGQPLPKSIVNSVCPPSHAGHQAMCHSPQGQHPQAGDTGPSLCWQLLPSRSWERPGWGGLVNSSSVHSMKFTCVPVRSQPPHLNW